MCYLACLALAGLFLAQRSTAAWINDVGSEVTILVRPLDGVDVDAEVSKAATLAKSTAGVISVTVLDRSSAAKLLEPWLGKDVATGLPLPQLISVQIDQNKKPDFILLERTLAEQVKGASLDTHQRWQAEFASLGRGLILLASAVLAVIAFATATLVSFAARSVMQTNSSVVEVLQLVGAEPKFIACANDRQFLGVGITSGLIGVGSGVATLGILVFLTPTGQSAVTSATASLLFGSAYGVETFGGMVLIPITATLLAVWVARFTLLHALANPK